MTLSLSWRARGALTGLAAAALAVSGLPGSVAHAADDPAPLVGMDAGDIVPGSYIVVLDESASSSVVQAAGDRANEAGGQVTHRYTDAIKGFSAKLTESELAEVRDDPAVDHVEPVVTVRTFASPVRRLDTQSGPDWGLDRIDQRARPLNESYFWKGTNEGVGVKAYVLDTGIRRTHQDFRDTEGGSTASRVAAGYDATGEGNGPEDCADQGHGTHVAGTLGGTVYGVAKRVTLVPVQVFRCDGQDTDNSSLLAGMDWVIRNHTGGPAVANLSLGGPAAGNGAIDRGVNKMIADGISVVVAAGNFDSRDPDPAWRTPIACNYTPAKVPGAITVSATTTSDSRDTSYAAYGKCVDVFAPGTGITSDFVTSDTAVATGDGTSMATPHVAGIVATYLSTHRNATPAQVHAAIVGGATKDVVRSAGTGSPNRLAYSRIFPPVKTAATDRLTSDTGLRLGESIVSPNGLYRLRLQTDGNLVLTRPGNRVLWSLGKKSSWLTLQANGNLVAFLYTRGVWATNTGGNGASILRVQDDGNVVLRRLDTGVAVWTTKTRQKTAPPQVTTPTDRLTAGQAIYRGGKALTSPSGRYAVYVRASNGVLVVRDTQRSLDIWTTKALNDDWLTLKTDGNAVLYSSGGRAMWKTDTAGIGDARLIIQNDGNFVLYDNSPNKAVWSSKKGKL